MKTKKNELSRRNFLKSAGAGGIGAMLAPCAMVSGADASRIPKITRVPTRPFGKTGVFVSILGMGGMFDIPNNQIILKQALRLGITYWDTAESYGYGRSEEGIGKFFSRYPEERKSVFLVTKSGNSRPESLTRDLEKSLKRMQTSYTDLYFLHGIRSTRALTEEIRRWAGEAKAQGKIRFFGFSTHSNMEECLLGASKLGWIDGIMMTYNYRLMHSRSMKKAVAACADAGIGLTAMKTQGGGSVRTDSETELELAGRFVKKGFTTEQARLKAVWEDTRIAGICSQMPSVSILMANAAAATSDTPLSKGDRRMLNQYAGETSSTYCSGCREICEPVFNHEMPICDIMRYLMYARNYGDRDLARSLYGEIPQGVRNRIAELDYGPAEDRCPRRMAIGRLMREATVELV